MSNKENIALSFIKGHKHDDPMDWTFLCPGATRPLEWVYDNLVNGLYGEVTKPRDGIYSIEISGHDSKTGKPVVFEWSEGNEDSY